MMKNIFHFANVFVLKIFKFLSDFFGHVEKRLDKKAKVNFKTYDVISGETNYYNTHIVQYLWKERTIRQ